MGAGVGFGYIYIITYFCAVIQRKKIHFSVFLALLAFFSMGLQQGRATVLLLESGQHARKDGALFTVNTPDFIAAGEQKNGFSLLKITGKPAFKTRISSWLNNPVRYRSGEVSAVRYFSEAKHLIVSLEPPDLIFPFHNFW